MYIFINYTHTHNDWSYKSDSLKFLNVMKFNRVRHFVMITDIELDIVSEIIHSLNVYCRKKPHILIHVA